MKITRRQLRRLIKESILNEMPFIKPGGEIELDDEGYGKLSDLALSPDEMNQGMADDLARSTGYPDDKSFSSDMKHYEEQPGSIMIQQELDDLSVEVGLPESRYERKIFTVEEIKKDLTDYLHFELLTSGVLDPNVFTHPIPSELKGKLLDEIKISIQSAMSQGGMSLEQMAEEMMDYLLGMYDLPEKFYEEDYSIKDDYAKEIKRRYTVALSKLAGL
jgi:hypothetical protein